MQLQIRRPSSLLCYVSATICVSNVLLGANALQHGQNARSSRSMSSSNASSRKPPHIVFVVMDDLGYTDMGYAGGKIYTPMFDWLASEGAVLENYYVYSSCAPTRSAIMTGRHGTHTGINLAFSPLSPMAVPQSDVMIPEALKANGYATHMVGKWHLGAHKWENTPTFRGFDSFYGFLGWQETYFEHEVVGLPVSASVHGVYDLHFQNQSQCGDGCHSVRWDDKFAYSTELYANRAVDIIQDHDPETPLFLYLAEQAPHGPIQPPPGQYMQPPYLPSDNTRDEKFAATLAAADARFQDVFDALVSKGMLGNTIIIFSSDNGGPMSTICCENTGSTNYPLRGAKHTLFEGGIKVTGFVWSGEDAPQVMKGVHKGLMHGVDWFPTLMHLAGDTSSTRELDGQDQWSALESGTSARESLFLGGMYEEESQTLLGVMTEDAPFAYAVRDRNWKLIVGQPGRREFSGWGASDLQNFHESFDVFPSGSTLLYDLDKDPREENDVAASEPDVVQKLKDIAGVHITNFASRDHATDAFCPPLDVNTVDALLPWC